ncbi:MAG: biotin/lipoyl-containing protein, partial [Chitinophagales bacterium]
IKKAYEEVNEMFGDIVKVTPSSKVVGDMAMFMVTGNLSKEDIFTKGASLSFPQSVIGYFRGDLGQPYGGFPKELQKIILKDTIPYADLPNKHLAPVDFDAEFAAFTTQFGKGVSFLDFLSYKMYPKVFEEFHAHKKEYGNVSAIPSQYFFFGLKQNEEILIEIDKGKSIMVRLLNILPPDESGYRSVFFRLNGQTRVIECLDKKSEIKKATNKKVSSEKEIGAPLQGMLSKIFVKEGDAVKKNQPLFTIEAMKMETTITATKDGKITRIVLSERTMVEAEDVVLELE